jgi:hypothetical protein
MSSRIEGLNCGERLFKEKCSKKAN